MVRRRYPEISAYKEGQQEAEQFIPALMEEYADRGFSTHVEAVQHYGDLAFELLGRVVDPEHQALLRGYLSKFD